MTKKINFLKYDINLTTKQTTRILSSWPKYLSYSYIKLQYCKNFLINNVYDLTNDELSKMIYALPQILAHSVDENLKYKLIFLEDEVGCSKEQVKRIACRYPRIFSISVDNSLRPKVSLFHFLYYSSIIIFLILSMTLLLSYNSSQNYLHLKVMIMDPWQIYPK